MKVVDNYHNPCPNEETVRRLHEVGYIISKYGSEKTWTQEEVMEIFRSIIEGEHE